MLTSVSISVAMTVAVIIVHYWSLRGITRLSKKWKSHFAMSVTVVMCIFALHFIEIIWYAIHIFMVNVVLGVEGFSKPFSPSSQDYFHLAAASYSTLGVISPTPVGRLAIVIDFISLTGFMMLTWSATYYYNIFSNSHRPDNKN